MSAGGPRRFDALPTELYQEILAHIPCSELQRTTAALILALPRSPVPKHELFFHIQLNKRVQIPKLWMVLSKSQRSGEIPSANMTQSFVLDAWDPDADVLTNTMELVPHIKYLHLNVGMTFAPEHLEDLFRRPRISLKLMSLRFRPYVEKPTYFQFLKGSYSDSMIVEMSKWPPVKEFRYLSILQDPIPRSASGLHTFAQPIVFFSLKVMNLLAVSPLASSLEHVRIRVPSRPVITELLTPGSLPSTLVLDLGTTSLGNPLVSLPKLLNVMPRIRHLLLDDCCLSREGWKDLGRALAIAGLSRANARENALKKWAEANSHSTGDEADDGSLPPQSSTSETRRPRKGRRGLATATFSIRSPSPPRQLASPTTSQHASVDPQFRTALADKIRIFPPVPRLESLSTTLFPKPDKSKRSEWRNEFASGWLSGVATVRAVRTRLRTSFRAGSVRLMRFDEDSIPGGVQTDEPHGLLGLLDMDWPDEGFREWESSVPMICFGVKDLHSSRDVKASDPNTRADVSANATVQPDLEGENDHEPNCGHARFGNCWDLYTRIDLDE